jgi:hypothetical protein
MEIEQKPRPGEMALNCLLGEKWSVVRLGKMGQPNRRRFGRLPNRPHQQFGAASV